MRLILVSGLFVLSPLAALDASAQANWRVTIIRVSSAGETVCSDTSVTITIPGGANQGNGAVCTVLATLTVGAQSVTLELSGNFNYQGCLWNIISPIRGSGFISGNAVPATSMTGTARTQCQGGVFTNEVTGSFQAQLVVAGGATPVVNFTGQVQVTRPGQAPLLLTPQNIVGLTLPAGTQIQVGAASSLTLRFADGDVALGANTGWTIFSPRFFLLTPSFFPLQGTFARIVWRCIPGVQGCATIATPNTRLAFLPIGRPFGVRPQAAGDLAFTVTYTPAAGLGTTAVSVEGGTIGVVNLSGESSLVSAGESRSITSFAAGAGPLNLNGDTVPDIFTYNATSGAWSMALAGGLPASSGRWSPDWDVRPADFDGNGLTDFLLHNVASGRWSKMLNTGGGSFSEFSGSWPAGWRSSVVNLNGDRWSDVFLHQPATGQWIKAINKGSGDFQQYTGAWAAGWDPQPLELNTDDAVDMLLFNPTTGDWSLALNDGAGGFSYPATGRWAGGATHVFPGDFNGDGRWDALVYDARSGAWSVATNTGTGFSLRGGTWTPALTVTVGDVDADGDADVFLYDPASGRWSYQISEGTGDSGGRLTPGTAGSWSPRWEVYGSDFNTDGQLDFFLYYREAGTWMAAISGGSGAFTTEEGTWVPGLTIASWQSLTQGPLLNDAPFEPCSSESDLRSTEGTAARWIEFVNTASEPRQVYWLNYQGQRVRYNTLAPGQRYVQETLKTHPWLVTDGAGTCQAIYVPGDVPNQATLR